MPNMPNMPNTLKISTRNPHPLTSEQKARVEEALRHLSEVRDIWQVMAARVELEKLLRESA